MAITRSSLRVRGGITRSRRSQGNASSMPTPAPAPAAAVGPAAAPNTPTPQADPAPPAPLPAQEQENGMNTPEDLPSGTSPYKKRFGEINDGYIEHKGIGLVMHPSFYDNDEEDSDFVVCKNNRSCKHPHDCYEIRKRMAVLACIRGLTYREAAYLWDVSKSTLQREVAENGNRMSLKFLIIPEKE